MKRLLPFILLISVTTVNAQEAKPFKYNPNLDLYEADKEVITQLGDTLGMKLMLIDQEKGEAMPWHAHPLHHSYYFYEGKRGKRKHLRMVFFGWNLICHTL